MSSDRVWRGLELTRRERGLTNFAILLLPRCFGKERLCLRSESCCNTEVRKPRRSMPRSTLSPCERWRCRGRGRSVHDEHAPRRRPRLPRDAPQPGIQVTRRRDWADEIHFVPRATKRIAHYPSACSTVDTGKFFRTIWEPIARADSRTAPNAADPVRITARAPNRSAKRPITNVENAATTLCAVNASAIAERRA